MAIATRAYTRLTSTHDRLHTYGARGIVMTMMMALMWKPCGAAAGERELEVTHGWKPTNAVLSNNDVGTITLWLQPNAQGALERTLNQVSDPRHKRFRNFLSEDEITQLVEPTPQAMTRVIEWIEAAPGLTWRFGKHHDYIFVSGGVHHLETLLGGLQRFCEFVHEHARSNILRACSVPTVQPENSINISSPSKLHLHHNHRHLPNSMLLSKQLGLIPTTIATHVSAMFGVYEFFPVISKHSKLSQPRNLTTANPFPGVTVNPTVIRTLYNISEVGGKSSALQMSQGVAAFEDAQFNPSDVVKFQKDYNLTSASMSVLGPNHGGYFGEASLDTQYIFATGDGVAGWFLSQEQFDLLSWSFLVMNMTHPPKVLSISWGGGESGYPVDHMLAANLEFAKMGLQGISVFAASGDAGTGKQGMFCKKFDATWPASSPYVTSVGGTYLDATSHTELGWSDSGGGFSSVFARPRYQDEQVSTYLNSSIAKPSASLFNSSGRALPDVSAIATNFEVCSSGSYGPISGTSAATPTFAGMVSVIVDELVSQNKVPLGFISPLLYNVGGDVGTDIVEGNNKQFGCAAGFSATGGWDPITGIGTPMYAKLKAALLSPL
eukprot:m.113758 g.113758  ORF g.113758 m.113758 type:complete len:607 (-) comp28294_c0_seq2:190-2010(-)